MRYERLGYTNPRVRHPQSYVTVMRINQGSGVGKSDGGGEPWGLLASLGMRIGLNLGFG